MYLTARSCLRTILSDLEKTHDICQTTGQTMVCRRNVTSHVTLRSTYSQKFEKPIQRSRAAIRKGSFNT